MILIQTHFCDDLNADFMLEKAHTWTTASSRVIADCRVFTVRENTSVRDADAASSTFFVIDNPNWVNIVAITKERDVILIEQFRHGSGSMILEIPGGMVDDGEDPEAAAARELVEETGFSPGRMIAIGSSQPNPAIQNNRIYHYLALDCEKTSKVEFDDHESIITRLEPLRDLEDLMHNGSITHSLAITAIYFAQRYLKNEGLIT